jgi:dipeptidase
MLKFALEYRVPIDAITAVKDLKIRHFELDDEDWIIIQDLVNVLEVGLSSFVVSSLLIAS